MNNKNMNNKIKHKERKGTRKDIDSLRALSITLRPLRLKTYFCVYLILSP